MPTVIDILAGLAILANGVIYGTDVFGAIVLRPAIAGRRTIAPSPNCSATSTASPTSVSGTSRSSA